MTDQKVSSTDSATVDVPKTTESRKHFYSRLKEVKKLKGGFSPASVVLLEGGVVKKYYKSVIGNVFNFLFEKEVNILKRLKGYPHVPQLLFVNKKKHEMYMTYCGKRAPPTEETRSEMQRIFSELRTRYGVTHDREERYHHKAGTCNNVTIKDGKIYLIDFGENAWNLKKRTKVKSKSA